MQALVFPDIASKVIGSNDSGGTFSFPKIIAGNDIRLKLRLIESLAGQHILSRRTISAMKMSVGKQDARPTAGSFKLKLVAGAESGGVNTTDALAFDATGPQLAAALNALTDSSLSAKKSFIAEKRADSWHVQAADGSTVPWSIAHNTLLPQSIVSIRDYEEDATTKYEIRLIQTPVAEQTNYADIVPELPTVSVVQHGADESGVKTNTIQKIYFPPELPSGYAFRLKWGFRRTTGLVLPIDKDQVQKAINAILETGESVTVSAGTDALLLEFQGDALAGTDVAALEIESLITPAADHVINLSTATDGMAKYMDTVAAPTTGLTEFKLPLSLTLWLVDEQDAEKTEEVTFLQEVTFVKPVSMAAFSNAAELNPTQPLARHSYTPFSPTQIVETQRGYLLTGGTALGDGSATEFTVSHNLGTRHVYVSLFDSAVDGAQIIAGTDYTVEIVSDNAIKITFTVAPASGGVVGGICTVASTNAFVDLEINQGQVIDLDTRLAAIEAVLSTLSAIAPSGGLTVDTTETTEAVAQWTLPNFVDLYPTRISLALPVTTTNSQGQSQSSLVALPKSIAEITPAWLANLGIRDGGLLPAIHRANVVDLFSIDDFGSDSEGTVFKNLSGGDLALPGRKGRKTDLLHPDEFAAYYNGYWYRVANAAGTKSYFPTQFDRTLFTISVNAQELRLKKTLTLPFGFEVGIITNLAASLEQLTNSPRLAEAQWTLVIEWGEYVEEELTPDDDQDLVRDTAPNIQDIAWHTDTPLCKHRFIVTTTPATKEFGVEIMVNAAGEISANKVIAKGKEGAPTYTLPAPTEEDPEATEERSSVPTTRDFALRARLIEFDTRNVWLPQGLVALIGLDRGMGTSIGKNGIAQIK